MVYDQNNYRALLAAFILSACSPGPSKSETCVSPEKIGQFDPSKDLFLAHFDIKTDTDDLHSAAAVATILASPGFECVNYRAVSGTYGTQGGECVNPENIFKGAFGANWVDAHSDRAAAIEHLAGDVAETLSGGGHVWIMEGGYDNTAIGAGGLDFSDTSGHVDFRL